MPCAVDKCLSWYLHAACIRSGKSLVTTDPLQNEVVKFLNRLHTFPPFKILTNLYRMLIAPSTKYTVNPFQTIRRRTEYHWYTCTAHCRIGTSSGNSRQEWTTNCTLNWRFKADSRDLIGKPPALQANHSRCYTNKGSDEGGPRICRWCPRNDQYASQTSFVQLIHRDPDPFLQPQDFGVEQNAREKTNTWTIFRLTASQPRLVSQRPLPWQTNCFTESVQSKFLMFHVHSCQTPNQNKTNFWAQAELRPEIHPCEPTESQCNPPLTTCVRVATRTQCRSTCERMSRFEWKQSPPEAIFMTK